MNANKIFEDIMNEPDEMVELLLINNTRVSLDKIKIDLLQSII